MNRGRGRGYMPLSESDDHGTPRALFDALAVEFGGFTVDCASSWQFAKCSRFISPEDDALTMSVSWGTAEDRGWLNPPYGQGGRMTRSFAYRARREAEVLGLLVCLYPAKTSTHWWHDVVMRGPREVRIIERRLTFETAAGKGEPASAPGGHAIVIYERGYTGKPVWLSCDVLGRVKPEPML